MRSSIILTIALFVACAAARPMGRMEGEVARGGARASGANDTPDVEKGCGSGKENKKNGAKMMKAGRKEAAGEGARGGRAGETGGNVQCPIVFDGRVPNDFKLTDFDAKNGLFNPDNVLGNTGAEKLKFSDVLEFPEIDPSKFDGEEFKALEVTINDNSIFNNQTGFRRTGLLFQDNSGKEGDPSIVGVKTFHWSVMQDAAKPFNLSHEYLTAFHETADFSGNQFNFLAGELIAGVPEGAKENDAKAWKILDRANKQIFSTEILENEWQNFAVTMDFEKNTLQVFTSVGDEPLKAAGEPVENDNSGGGQFQIGILKKPTDAVDVTKDGFQEANINEGQIYGGIFVEDSAQGCISL